MAEDLVLLRALVDSNLPKLVQQDNPLFNALLGDLFPGVEMNDANYGELDTQLGVVMAEWGLQDLPQLRAKVWQLMETKNTRHGVMVIGGTGGGKTTCYRLLAEAKCRTSVIQASAGVADDDPSRYHPVSIQSINPKSLSLGELFGATDPHTREWTDGVVSSLLRTASQDASPKEKWLVFDGPVDTLWIESMNTVLDDSKVLTLINGERISFPDQVTFLFESQDLTQASPATVSRCGMVFLDETLIGWRPVYQSWVAKKVAEAKHNPVLQAQLKEHLTTLGETVLAKAIEYSQEKEILTTTAIANVHTLSSLFDALANSDSGITTSGEGALELLPQMISMWFIFALIWSVGGNLIAESRKKFDLFIREVDSQFSSTDTVYEYRIDPVRKAWVHWNESIPKNWRPPAHVPLHQILVPTVDTLRLNYLVNSLVRADDPRHEHMLVMGPSGVGKTAVISQTLLPALKATEQFHTMNIGLSAQTTAERTQVIIESRMERRSKGTVGPQGGKPLVCFVDDLNMPAKEEYGAQPPLELLRQYIDSSGWYDRSKQTFTTVRDLLIVAAMGEPGGGRNDIPARLMSRFAVFGLTFPSTPQIKRIFGTLIGWRF
ncbi:dynein heavy chain, partial [Kipferlia bialata]|eukprot:g8845.t1